MQVLDGLLLGLLAPAVFFRVLVLMLPITGLTAFAIATIAGIATQVASMFTIPRDLRPSTTRSAPFRAASLAPPGATKRLQGGRGGLHVSGGRFDVPADSEGCIRVYKSSCERQARQARRAFEIVV